MFVVIACMDGEANFVQQRAKLQRYTLSRWQPVNRRKLVEQLRREPPHVFAMRRIGMHTQREPARLLAQSFGTLVMSGGRAEMSCSQIVQQAFADTDDQEQSSGANPASR